MYITELDYHCDLLTSPIVEVDTDIDLSMLLFTMDGLAQVLEKHEEFPANLFYHDTHIVAWYAGRPDANYYLYQGFVIPNSCYTQNGRLAAEGDHITFDIELTDGEKEYLVHMINKELGLDEGE